MKTLEDLIKLDRLQEMPINAPLAKSKEEPLHTQTSLPSEMPIRNCKESQNQLTTLLAQCWLLLKGYGEKAEDAVTRDGGFQWLLGRFTISEVKSAFEQYISTNSDMPAPADIIKIIEPPPKPLSGAHYVSLMRQVQEGKLLYGSDKEFVEAFRQQENAKVGGGELKAIESQLKQLEHIGE